MAEMLIPIKEFPRCCGRCPCFHAETPMYCQADKTIRMTAPYGKRMEGCLLVEIPPHGNLKDTDELQEALSLVLSLVMTPDLTDKEIGLVQRTISAVSSVINDMDTIVETTE